MKKSFSLTNIIFTLLIIPFLWSCNNLFSNAAAADEPAQAEYVVSGSFSMKGSVPSGFSVSNSVSRSALPAYPVAANIFYNITASLDSDSTIVRQGSVSENNFFVKLTKTGIWTLSVEGFSDAGKTKKIFFGSTQITLGQNELEKNGVKIELNSIKSGSGNIDLKIKVTDDSGINLIKASLVSVSDNTPIISENFEAFPAAIVKNDVASGSYMLSLSFYDKKESEADKNLIYAAQERVNVFDNLTTNYWQGGSEYINSMDGTFTVTKANIEKFASTTLFVQGTGGTYTPSHPASDENTGTYFDPYATVQKACDRILAINDGNSTYTIYVDGTVTAPNNEHSVVELNSANVTKNLNLKIEGLENAKLLGGATKDLSKGSDSTNARLVLVEDNTNIINLTLKNIDIANGGGMPKYKNWARGGGIYFCAGADSTLILDNVKIYDCKGIWGGGAMFENSKVILKNGTVIGNKEASSVANADEDKYSNFSNGNGAGFLIEGADADVTIGQDCYVAYNCHKRNDSDGNSGGGIALQGGKLLIEEGAFVQYNSSNRPGGGIYFGGGTANIEGSVLYNYAANGGGIYVKGNTTLTVKGTIRGNSASDGGGIYADTGANVELNGSARIDSDNDVYLSSGKTITISGDLTGTVPVATITPAEWTAGTAILSEETSGLLAGNYKKFRVSDTDYRIKEDGKLYYCPDVAKLETAPTTGETVYCTSQAGLNNLAEWVQGGKTLSGVTIKLDQDIDCTGDFKPIGGGEGYNSNKFSGTIDGNGHIISGIDLTNATTYYKAFVPYLSGGTIKNLTLCGTSSDCAFTKGAEKSIIENCVNEIKINNTDDSKTSIGGFCGAVYGNLTITGCTNKAAITSRGNYVGGIIGHLSGGNGNTFSKLINKKTVHGKDEVGGIVGYSLSSDIINSANYGIVQGTNRVGGILGSLSTTNKNVGIKNCHNNDGWIYADKEAGGIVGYVYLAEHNAYIQNCYSRPTMSTSAGGNQTKGCVLGLISGAGYSNLYMESTYYYKTFYSGFGANNGTTISSSCTNASDPIMITDDNPISNAITALNVWVESKNATLHSETYSAWIVDGIHGKFTWE